MITTADEFVRLRTSDNKEEQYRATHDTAKQLVWNNIINKYPDFKIWVIHNKTVPLEILEVLAKDTDPNVRAAVARKRKINNTIFILLTNDSNEEVRHALISNTKLSKDQLMLIKTNDSEWLQASLKERLQKQ